MAISPDGTVMAYMAGGGAEGSRIYLRNMDDFDARPVPGSERSNSLFFSPDGEWLGFFSSGVLKKTSVLGGVTQEIAETPDARASWGGDDLIVIGSTLEGRGLSRVSANGGEPETLTIPNTDGGELSHAAPQVLPDGSGVLFTVVSQTGSRIAVLDLRSGEWSVIPGLDATDARYAATGHLVYRQATDLIVAPFATADRRLTGSPVNAVSDVEAFAVSEAGLLVYRRSAISTNEHVWVSRTGEVSPTRLGFAAYNEPRLSHSGERLAVEIGGDIWIYDLVGGGRSQLTTEGSNDGAVWSPDDIRIAFCLDALCFSGLVLDAVRWKSSSRAVARAQKSFAAALMVTRRRRACFL